jgi:hypothetical protein
MSVYTRIIGRTEDRGRSQRQRLQLQIGETIARRFGKLSGGVKFQFTNHAQRALAEREIAIEWVERTLEAPECLEWPSTGRLNRTEL